MRSHRFPLPVLLAGMIVLLAGLAPSAFATPGDTTWVRTFDHDFYNWGTWHQQTFSFPDSGLYYRQILLYYRIECPDLPGDCDPWDRRGTLRVVQDTVSTEIARIITPYDITGGGRPGHCVWLLDASDYEPLLHGDVELASYIDTWINGNLGWIVTVDFAMIEGVPELKPYKIVNLWQNDYAVYGDPTNPIENVLAPRTLQIDSRADAVKFRMITTGHGQGNTQNCAEFCAKNHTIHVNDASWAHVVWRSDCESNLCSPQGGTWTYDRAGWCPGDKVTPWDVDVTGAVTPGEPATLDYDVQAYTNLCCPNNPDCIPNGACPDCNYNYNGHTEPYYMIQTQLIYYRAIPVADAGIVGEPPALLPNMPNPFSPSTWIRYSLDRPGDVRLLIHDAGGRSVREIVRRHAAAGTYVVEWDGRDDGGAEEPAGVYFCTMRVGEQTRVRKMVLLR